MLDTHTESCGTRSIFLFVDWAMFFQSISQWKAVGLTFFNSRNGCTFTCPEGNEKKVPFIRVLTISTYIYVFVQYKDYMEYSTIVGFRFITEVGKTCDLDDDI